MDCKNNASRLRREVLIRVTKAWMDGKLIQSVDRIPYQIRPKDHEATRCCIYKDRAVLRFRCMAAMGFAIEDETDDFTPLADYAEKAIEREQVEGPVMTVLDIACKGCVPSRFLITDACQGCVARPCAVNCPFGAISVFDGRARIDREKCRNCGKCLKVCPYNAVTRIPVPCEDACPVGAIRKKEDGKARIDFDACISCGRCMRACPFGAVMEKSHVLDVLRSIGSEKRTVALVAPAVAGQFPGDLGQIATALKKLGFSSVVEVALGADKTAQLEAHEFVERMEKGDQFMTTSCCPAYMETLRRHVPDLAPFASETRTPMHYTAAMVREQDPEAVTVFIGPCVAKRREAMDDPMVDYVLTFEEAGAMFVAAEIEVGECESMAFDQVAHREGRGFPVTGGVAAAVESVVRGMAEAGQSTPELRPHCINGLDMKTVKLLATFPKGRCPGNLVEVMACEGGCCGGAGVVGSCAVTARKVAEVRDASEALPGSAR